MPTWSRSTPRPARCCGTSRWRITRTGHSITVAPLVVKDMVICGISGGEYGIRGFLDAYDAATGKRRWRFWTIPEPGQPGSETWPGDAWKTGGAPTWVTGSFDAEQNLIIWGTGNPSPDWNGDSRRGDNLYSDSAIALDADTGKLKWYFQFVPHDVHDWDATQVPVLVDGEWRGQPRKLVYWAHRNGFYYVLDRENGHFPLRHAVRQADLGQGARLRRPSDSAAQHRSVARRHLHLARRAGRDQLVFTQLQSAHETFLPCRFGRTAACIARASRSTAPGNRYIGSVPLIDLPEDPGHGAIRALNPQTGERVWDYKLHTKPWAGVLSTAGQLVFGGSDEGLFLRARRRDRARKCGGRILAASSAPIR